jgi:nicotinamide mononucleotide transporter
MIDFFLNQYKGVPHFKIWLEFIAFVFGIASVWYARKENILVYPTGLIATIISTYLFLDVKYFGDAIVNGYYTIMSFYGWYYWRKMGSETQKLKISRTNRKEKITGIALFFFTIFVVFAIYTTVGQKIENDNYVDILLAGIFFTGMWYMARKKIENWTLWIIGDIIAIPLCAYRGFGMFSVQYLIFTILAVSAYLEWKKILNNNPQPL